jgi:hypothetical protein
MRYKLSEYNENRYHDSYWGVYVFNTESNKVEKVMTGTTSCYMTESPEYKEELPVELLPALRKFYRDEYFNYLMDRKEQVSVRCCSYSEGTKVEAARTFRHKGNSYQKGTKFKVLGSKLFGGEYSSMTLEMENGQIIYTSAKNLKYGYSVREMMQKSVEVAENKLPEVA